MLRSVYQNSILEIRYYFLLMSFSLRENYTDLRATGVTYFLFCFFIWLLSLVWVKFHPQSSHFSHAQVFLYLGVTEMLFMSFLSKKMILRGTEDFSLFLARPRSWLAREICSNIGNCLGKRIMYSLFLLAFSFLLGASPANKMEFIGRIIELILLLAIPQALLVTLFSAFRLSYTQTDYFILPFSKLFLALGVVFGPLSDFADPWKKIFLQLPGSDLFFQPAFYAVHGHFYQTTGNMWLFRLLLIDSVLILLLLLFYKRGRKLFQAWGG